MWLCWWMSATVRKVFRKRCPLVTHSSLLPSAAAKAELEAFCSSAWEHSAPVSCPYCLTHFLVSEVINIFCLFPSCFEYYDGFSPFCIFMEFKEDFSFKKSEIEN